MYSQLTIRLSSNSSLRNPTPKLIFRKNTQKLLETINTTLISQYITSDCTIEDIQISRRSDSQAERAGNHSKTKRTPTWLFRIKIKISAIRKELGHLTHFTNNKNNSKRIERINNRLKSKTPEKQ